MDLARPRQGKKWILCNNLVFNNIHLTDYAVTNVWDNVSH